jgi:hypothetical protein
MKRRALVTIVVLALATAGPGRSALGQPASSDQGEHELEGRIVNVSGEKIQLADGTVVRVPAGLAASADLREGHAVKLRYAVKDKENVATAIEFPDRVPAGTRQ